VRSNSVIFIFTEVWFILVVLLAAAVAIMAA